jgi:hypothetical protein
MKAIEFNTVIKEGLIHIPKIYQDLSETNARVIVMYEDSTGISDFDKDSFRLTINKARDLGLFRDITDSVDWQKKLRDEWE